MQNPHWHKAMDVKLAALEAYGTWTLVNLPARRAPIGYR